MNAVILLREVELSNNGYLFATTAQMLEVARQHPKTFSVSDGLIFKVGTSPAQYADETSASQQHQIADGTDYEALILNQQAAHVFND